MDATAQMRRTPAGAAEPPARLHNRRRHGQPTLLADALVELMEPSRNGLCRRYEASSEICSRLPGLLGVALAQHCRVVDLSAGTLVIEADSPSYMYELRLGSRQLLGQLRRQCPAANLRAVRVVLAS